MAARARQQEWSRAVLARPVSDWIAQLDGSDPAAAIRALGEHGAAALDAVEPLRTLMLEHPSAQTRRAALDALSHVDRQPATSAMLAFPDEELRSAAARILAYSDHQLPDRSYAAMLADANHNVRAYGFAALQRAGDAAAPFLDDMIVGLADRWGSVRNEAARAIGTLGLAGGPAIGPLTDRLDDADPNVIATAACALAKLGALPAGTVDALRPLAEHDYVWVRNCAAEALRPE